MNPGADVDILTGLPREMVEDEKRKEADARQEAAEMRQAGWASVSESEAAQALAKEIEAIIMERFEAWLAQDPAGGAAIRMLAKIKARDFTAQRAAGKIAERYSGRSRRRE